MRILLLAWDTEPGFASYLGRQVPGLAGRLAAAGHEVHLATDPVTSERVRTRDGLEVLEVVEAPPIVPPEPGSVVAEVLAADTCLQVAGSRLLLDRGVDLIHAFGWQVGYAAIGLRTTFDGLPLVATLTGAGNDRRDRVLPARERDFVHQVRWWLTYEARRVLLPTATLAGDVAEAYRLPEGKVVTLPPGVDPEEVRAAGAADEVGTRPPRVLVVMRPGDRMILGTAMRALRRLRSRGIDAEVEVVGMAGPEPLGGIGFSGDPGIVGLRGAVAGSDAVLVLDPDLWPTVPDVVVSGRPCVIAATGSLVDVAPGAWRVDPDDAEAVAQALAAALEEGPRRMAPGRYAWDPVVAQTASTYAAAISDEEQLHDDWEQPPLRPILQQHHRR